MQYPPLSKGSTLGPYQLISPLGSGGMAEVWKATDTRLNRIVAIKQIKGTHKERFQQEARLIASFSHPNIPFKDRIRRNRLCLWRSKSTLH